MGYRSPIGLVALLLAGAGCYASHELGGGTPVGDAATARDARAPGEPDAGTLAPTDAAVDLSVDDPAIDESLTCASGVARWAVDCPGAMVLYVSPTGNEAATGGAAEPMASPTAAFARCGVSACHLRLATGTYAVGGASLGVTCFYLEGGLVPATDAEWTRDIDGTSELVGDGTNDSMVNSGGGALVVTGVSIRAVHSGIGFARGNLLVVDHVNVHATYSAVSVSWSSTGARLCDSTLVAGYSAVDVSWSSSDVVLEHVDADGGYAGVDVSWSSHAVRIDDSTVSGGYASVDVTQGAYDVQVKSSTVTTRHDYTGG